MDDCNDNVSTASQYFHEKIKYAKDKIDDVINKKSLGLSEDTLKHISYFNVELPGKDQDF